MNSTHQHPNDEAIDQVLAALRDTPTLHGMERRILNTLEAETLKSVIPSGPRASAASRGGSRSTHAFQNARRASNSPLLRWAPWATACCTLAIVAIAVTLTARHHTAPAITTATNSTPTTIHPPAPTPQPTAIATTQPTPAHHIAAPTYATQPHPVEVAQSDDNQQISHPAPPIPITDQERLFLRYARRGHTDDLAQISNESRARREQQDAADFQAFFTPPEIPTGESE